MRRAIRAYFRNNAASLAEQCADRSIVYGKTGRHFRASDDGAVRIVRTAFEKHSRASPAPPPCRLRRQDPEGNAMPLQVQAGQAALQVSWWQVYRAENT